MAAEEDEIELMTHRICMNRGHLLKQIAWDGSGNYVLRTLFKNCNQEMKTVIAETVDRYVMHIDSASFARISRTSEFIYQVYKKHRARN